MNPGPTDTTAVRRPNAQSRHPRRWLPRLGAVLLVGLIVAGLWPQPVPVETAAATVGNLRATVDEEGKTRIRQRFTVSAPVSGYLRRMGFKAGAEVQAGVTVVAIIEPLSPSLLDARSRSLAEARRDTATANLEKARSAHSFAVSELHRFERLFKDGTVSVQELEPVQWREVATARDEAAAQSALRQAEAELAEFSAPVLGPDGQPRPPVEVRAPATGRVLRVIEESARAVTVGTPLIEIGDPTDLEVVIEVLSRDGAALSPGTHVELTQWGGNEPLAAAVRLLEPAAFTKVSALGVEEQRVRVIADLVTPPEKRPGLGDNFRVEASIVVWESPQALKVPAGGLFRRGSDWAALVCQEGRALLRAVKVGRTSNTECQILEGLQAGELVILYPGDRVHAGDRVKVVKL